MSSNEIAPPRLPEPPIDYSIQYMADLVRALETFIARGTKITLTDLPTSATGLETGALYNDSGTVKVVT